MTYDTRFEFQLLLTREEGRVVRQALESHLNLFYPPLEEVKILRDLISNLECHDESQR